MKVDLWKKTALVTGASKGIGRATALALAEAGAKVLVHYGRSAVEAEAVATEIREKGGEAEVMSADLSTADGAMTLASQVKALDVLVLNAGVSKAALLGAYTAADLDGLFATNVRVPFSWCSNLSLCWVKGRASLP